MAPRYVSTWQRVRVVINPSEMVAASLHVFPDDLEAFGLLMRLVSYAAYAGLPKDPRRIARIVSVSTRTINRLWPSIAEYFEPAESGDGWRLRPCEWCRVQVISSDRISLTSLLDALVDYWGPRCAYCGLETDLEVEHVVPLARGGTNEITNLTVACHECNSRKRTKTAAEFGHPHIHDKAARIQ